MLYFSSGSLIRLPIRHGVCPKLVANDISEIQNDKVTAEQDFISNYVELKLGIVVATTDRAELRLTAVVLAWDEALA